MACDRTVDARTRLLLRVPVPFGDHVLLFGKLAQYVYPERSYDPADLPLLGGRERVLKCGEFMLTGSEPNKLFNVWSRRVNNDRRRAS